MNERSCARTARWRRWPAAVAALTILGATTPALAQQQMPAGIATTRALAAEAVPIGWREPGFDDRAWLQAAGPMVPGPALAAVAMPVGMLPDPRRGAGAMPDATATRAVTAVPMAPRSFLYTRTRFDLDAPERARSLELRIGYQDGFIAYLNGQEVARRNLIGGAIPGRRPLVAHGADVEHIYVPLPHPAPGRRLLAARDNVLAVEFRPAVGRSSVEPHAPAGQVELAVFSGVRIVRGPYLIAPAQASVSVAWETDLPARGVVWWQDQAGPNAPSHRVAAPAAATRQVVRLAGLAAGKTYRYWVEATAGTAAGDRAQSPPATFQAAPDPRQPLRFVVYGDMRAPGHAAHAEVVAGIARDRPALVLNTGDLVAAGSDEAAWQRYFEITAPLGAIAPVAPALGNHEAHLGGATKSWGLFGLRSANAADPNDPYTSFDWGGAHFVILDSNRPQPAQRDWLRRDLAEARQRHARAIFAFCHDGPWSHGTHGGGAMVESEFAPILAGAGTDVLFSGHDHLYERGVGATPQGPLPYVVTGGGGAPLYTPSCQATSVVPGAMPAGPTADAPPCPPSVAIIRKTYHYVLVEVGENTVRLCPRLPDGGPVEPCVEFPLRQPRAR